MNTDPSLPLLPRRAVLPRSLFMKVLPEPHEQQEALVACMYDTTQPHTTEGSGAISLCKTPPPSCPWASRLPTQQWGRRGRWAICLSIRQLL